MQAQGEPHQRGKSGGGFGVQYTLDSPMPGAGFFAEKIIPHLAARCQQLKIPAPMLTIEMKKKSYHQVIKGRFLSDPNNCVQCEECVEKCPFKLPIPALMKRAVEMFE
mgnify:CR=1 FL=1